MVAPTKPKKLLRAKNPPVTAVKKPHCKIHEREMVYSAVDACWKCVIEACTQKSYPKAQVEEDGKPIIGKGELELLKYTDSDKVTNFVLRATDNNVCFDVTEIVGDLKLDPFQTSGVILTLHLKRYATTDGLGSKGQSNANGDHRG